MKTLYIHMGTPKTATTAIQGFCRDNQEVLNKRGYEYPKFVFGYPGIGRDRNGHFLIGVITDENGNKKTEREVYVLRKGLKMVRDLFEKYDNIILSDEAIWQSTYKRRASLWQELKEAGESGGYQVKVIVYLRRQDLFISSWWNQLVKMGMNPWAGETWEEYIQHVPKMMSLDYYKKLETVAAVLGRENILVRRFDQEEFYGGSIYSDFLHTVGLTFSEDYVLPEVASNQGLMGNTHEIKRILNTIPGIDRETNQYFRDILSECSKVSGEVYPTQTFSKKEAEEFLEKYQKSNELLVRDYLKDGRPLFSMEVNTREKWQKNNPYLYDDMIYFMTRSSMDIMKQYHQLEEERKELETKLHQLLDTLPSYVNKFMSAKIFSRRYIDE